jgi:prepilin peptidase dependent protein B
MSIKPHSSGFSLAELMIALVISTLLVGSALSIMSATFKSNKDTVNAIHLNQELQLAMDLMTNQIRRAGYWASAKNDIGKGTNTNPFMAPATDVTINAAKNCILFSLDTDGNGLIPTLNTTTDDERYGFRLSGTSIQSRPSSAPFSCTAAATTWENITDPKTIAITQLQFVLTDSAVDIDGAGPDTSTIHVRNVDITITGNHLKSPSLSKTLTYRVKLRNDKYVP